jgi:hypothetical protein
MKANYTGDGSIHLTFDTPEDLIILKSIHGFKLGSREPQSLKLDLISYSNDKVVFGLDKPSESGTFTIDQISKLYAFLKNEQKLQAIKLVKEVTGLGLKESKDYVDKLFDEQKRRPITFDSKINLGV